MERKHWFSWPRLLCVLITAALLWFALSKVEVRAVWEIMRRTSLWTFVGALLAYQVALILAAYVWHVALRGVRCAAHALATNRFALIGHFFFVALFGAVGCDLAKSGVYARWFGFGLPEVLAAAPLERALRGVGALLLGVVVVLVGALSGGLEPLSRLRLSISPVWVALLTLAIMAVLLALRYLQPTGEGFIARLRRAFRAGVSALFRDRSLAGGGVVAAVLAQAAASAVLALNLAGVSDQPLPWLEMAWTFPTIIVLSCLPFTVAGTGVREVASVMFLGIYGVPPAQAVAASLLNLAQKLLLAGLGALAWWREEALLQKHPRGPVPKRISAVVPTLNEAAALGETVQALQAIPEIHQIIVADGGSQDDTLRIARELGCEITRTPPSRGGQMRAGAARASGEVVLFVHADTLLPAQAGEAIAGCLRDRTVVGGGFWKRFQRTPLPLLGARWKCFFRLVLGRKVLGDQGLFVRREVLESIGGVPDLPLMEEMELCKRLSKIGRLALADATVRPSARRFRQLGYLRTTWLTWKVSLLYRLGWPPEKLAAIYRANSGRSPEDAGEAVALAPHKP